MSARMFIKLSDQEAAALCRIAAQELRQPGEQARLLLRRALVERGLLQEEEEHMGTAAGAGR